MNYQLNLFNNAPQPFTFLVYQTFQVPQNFFSLAWLVSNSSVPPQNVAEFDWQDNYTMFWGQTGSIQSGLQFTSGGENPTDPQRQNQATFTAQPYPNFSSPSEGQPGSITISTDGSVSPNQFAVGIGMNGSPSIITSAYPMYNYVFPAAPTYWIAAVGYGMNVGTVLTPYEVPGSMQVVFPGGQYSASYAFDGNQWTSR